MGVQWKIEMEKLEEEKNLANSKTEGIRPCLDDGEVREDMFDYGVKEDMTLNMLDWKVELVKPTSDRWNKASMMIESCLLQQKGKSNHNSLSFLWNFPIECCFT